LLCCLTGAIFLIISHRVRLAQKLCGDEIVRKPLYAYAFSSLRCHRRVNNRVQQMGFQDSPNAMQAELCAWARRSLVIALETSVKTAICH
jgi:hypothetical protein